MNLKNKNFYIDLLEYLISDNSLYEQICKFWIHLVIEVKVNKK